MHLGLSAMTHGSLTSDHPLPLSPMFGKCLILTCTLGPRLITFGNNTPALMNSIQRSMSQLWHVQNEVVDQHDA